MARLLLTGGYVVTMDGSGAEHDGGWVLIEDGLVTAVGGADPPACDERVDLGGALVTPGLVNTHHHLYQTLTRARAQQADLFTWLRELYPVWAGIDAEAEVRGGAVCDADTVGAEPLDLRLGEVDAVGAPDVVAKPADTVEVLDRPAGVQLAAVGLLLDGLGEVRMELKAEAPGEPSSPRAHRAPARRAAPA